MRKLICFLGIAFFIFLTFKETNAQTVAILRDWAAYSGHSDSTFKTPVVNDGDYSYVASCSIEPSTGPDIQITKYDKDGHKIWAQLWSGPASARDQAADMVMDGDNLYVTGMTYTSSANNFDIVTIKLFKSDGSIDWLN